MQLLKRKAKLEKQLHVLILPEFLPYNEKGWGGFTWNYIKSVQPFCKATIFHSRLNGTEQGLTEHQIDENTKLIRYFPYTEKPSGIKKSVAYLKWFNACYHLLKDIKDVDVIHAHGVVLNGSLAKKLSRKWKIPYVLTEHTGPFSKVINSSYKKYKVKNVMENANAVLAVSNHLKNEILSNGIHPKRMEVTYNPIDTDLFQLKEKKLFKNIVFAGRMDENKGALRALKAFEIFQKIHADWTLTLCGDGKEMVAVVEYVKSHQLENSVIIKGMLSEKEVATEFHQADVFISPTQYESFGLSITEALSCGLPVITTNVTAPQEYVNVSNGILLEVNNIEKMAEALIKMVENLENYNSEKIREQVVHQFSVSNFGQRLFTIYKSL